jgi:hypothetical protein
MKRVLALGAMALALGGCGDDDAGDGGPTASIAGGAVTGKVGGATWTVITAQVDPFLTDDSEFWVDLYAEQLPWCDGFGSGNSLILLVPKQVGTHRLRLNGTFVIANQATGGDNLIAQEGAIRVDEITAMSVRGGVTMTYDADNSVSGEFDADICP